MYNNDKICQYKTGWYAYKGRTQIIIIMYNKSDIDNNHNNGTPATATTITKRLLLIFIIYLYKRP